MVRICADSSTMRNTAQAAAAGYSMVPLSVTINGSSYRELDEIDSDRFLQKIGEGYLPTSSQPSLGDMEDMFNAETQSADEVLHISMADGLSGAYQSCCTAASLCEHPEKVTVINSRTLCGPHRYLVDHAVRLAKEGLSCAEIVQRTEKLIETTVSFLIPADFAYLRRGGRLSPLVSYVGQAVRFVPLMTTTEDARRLTVAGVKRSFAQAVDHMIKKFTAMGAGRSWLISISHAAAPDRAQQALEQLKKAFPEATFEVLPLTPAFITQGGPGCVAVQIIKM